LNTALLSAGTHIITAVATDTDANPDSGSYSVAVNVTTTPPVVFVDSPAAGASVGGTVTVSGWAID
jgi:hypothetical protein